MGGLYLGLVLDKVRGISKSCCVARHTAPGLLEIMSDSRLHTIKWISTSLFLLVFALRCFISCGTAGVVGFLKMVRG